jgi:hypothetical protein
VILTQALPMQSAKRPGEPMDQNFAWDGNKIVSIG